MIFYLIAFFIAFVVTLISVPFCIYLARYLNFLDYPNNALKTHKQPTPYLGGVAIFVGLLSVFIIKGFSFFFFNLFLCFLLLLVVGLIDDRYFLKPLNKFLGQSLAVLLFFILLVKSGKFYYPVFVLPLCALWTLTVINAWNLVDIMDGMAIMLAFTAAQGLWIVAMLQKNHDIAVLLSAFSGSACAFFVFNAPRAKIYLGDAGSLLIGGFLSMSSFLVVWDFKGSCHFLIPSILCAIPLLECFSLIVIRYWNGIPFYQGSPHHFMHYLKKQQWSIKGILGYLFFASELLVVVSVLIFIDYLNVFQLFFAVLLFLFVWFSILAGRVSKKLFFPVLFFAIF